MRGGCADSLTAVTGMGVLVMVGQDGGAVVFADGGGQAEEEGESEEEEEEEEAVDLGRVLLHGVRVMERVAGRPWVLLYLHDHQLLPQRQPSMEWVRLERAQPTTVSTNDPYSYAPCLRWDPVAACLLDWLTDCLTVCRCVRWWACCLAAIASTWQPFWCRSRPGGSGCSSGPSPS